MKHSDTENVLIARVLCDNPCFFHLLIGTGLLRQTPCNKIVIIWVCGITRYTHGFIFKSRAFGTEYEPVCNWVIHYIPIQ